MSEARGDGGGQPFVASRANIAPGLGEYPAAMAIILDAGGRRFESGDDDGAGREKKGDSELRATNGVIVDNNINNVGKILNKPECFVRAASESLNETVGLNNEQRGGGILREEPLDIQCGEKAALLFVSKLCQGSKGPCILYNNEWLTPNELQYICGRETAKDWKRSIRHKGKSLKGLIAQGFLKVHPPICDCPGCRVSSPVNRSRLADKCGISKLPSYLAENSMIEGFPTMWRRSSTSSDETDQPSVLRLSESLADDESRPRRSQSDEPRYYRPADLITVAKRPRSSSPDLDRGRVNIKRRCMSETSAEQQIKPAANEVLVKAGLTANNIELKREHMTTGNGQGSLGRDHPVLTLPSSVFTSNVLYGHNQAHLGLHRHVNGPRILSPSFVRPAASPSAQIRLFHDQGVVAPLPPHIYAQQLRQDYPGVGMATMFPYPFTHPLPSNQLLATHFQNLTPELERHIGRTAEPSTVGSSPTQTPHDKTNASPKDKDDDQASEHSSSPGSDPFPGRKEVEGQGSGDKSRRSSVDENFNEADDQSARIYPELAQIAAQWDVEEVCKFVTSVTGCTEYCDLFRDEEIDGQAMILLTEEHLSNKMGIKLGPALKIKSKIDELRCVYRK